MPPRKAKKMALGEFLGDGALGSWADEMDSLPSAPAPKSEEDRDRFNNRRDDFISTRPDRAAANPREDLPLPTAPPFTAFIGNLAFDLTEQDLGEFFGTTNIKSVKIIKDREDKPKGFGYIEFVDLDGLKDALSKTNMEFAGRMIRVSVAEPQRGSSGGGLDDDSKFDNPWRRDGPLPEREGPRRRAEGAERSERPTTVSDNADQWRSARPRAPIDSEPPPFRRKSSGFGPAEGVTGAADREDTWVMGSKFKASGADSPDETASGSKYGGVRRSEPSRDNPAVQEDSDWRKSRSNSTNNPHTGSTPPTPQMGRRKLELLPRTGSASVAPSPLSSPNLAPSSPTPSNRANPFGGAKPVDVTNKEREVAQRLEKEREAIPSDRTDHPVSRTSSRTGNDRSSTTTPSRTSQASVVSPPTTSTASKISTAPKVQPAISFANVAGRKDTS
jgi:translation initiation factor 4B